MSKEEKELKLLAGVLSADLRLMTETAAEGLDKLQRAQRFAEGISKTIKRINEIREGIA